MVPSRASALAGPARVIIAGPIAAQGQAPALSRIMYRSVLAEINTAFSAYQGRSAAREFNSGVTGDSTRLMNQVQRSVSRLPHGVSAAWNSIRVQIDPVEISPENAPRYRERVKAIVRASLRELLRQGRIVLRGQPYAVRSLARELSSPTPAAAHAHVPSAPPRTMTPF